MCSQNPTCFGVGHHHHRGRSTYDKPMHQLLRNTVYCVLRWWKKSIFCFCPLKTSSNTKHRTHSGAFSSEYCGTCCDRHYSSTYVALFFLISPFFHNLCPYWVLSKEKNHGTQLRARKAELRLCQSLSRVVSMHAMKEYDVTGTAGLNLNTVASWK